MDELTAKTSNLIQGFQQKLEAFLPGLEMEVDQVIAKKSTDSNEIENYLDTLLSMCIHGKGDSIYIKLLEYYKTVDTTGAQFYWEQYENLED